MRVSAPAVDGVEGQFAQKGKEDEQRQFTARCAPWQATWTKERGELGATVVTVKLNPHPFLDSIYGVLLVKFRLVT